MYQSAEEDHYRDDVNKGQHRLKCPCFLLYRGLPWSPSALLSRVSGQTENLNKTGERPSRSDTMTVLLTDWLDTFTHSEIQRPVCLSWNSVRETDWVTDVSARLLTPVTATSPRRYRAVRLSECARLCGSALVADHLSVVFFYHLHLSCHYDTLIWHMN